MSVSRLRPTLRSPEGRWQWRRSIAEADWSVALPVLLLLGMTIAYLRLQPSAFSTATITSVLTDALPLILVGAGQTIVIISGGIDISVGGIMSLTSVLAATRLTGGGLQLILWTLLLVLMGVGLGGLNGIVIALLDLSPIIVTIATWSIWGGLALFVLNAPGGNVAPEYQTFWAGATAGLPNGVYVVILLAAIWTLFRRTRIATHLYATGSDREAARVTGVSIRRMQILAYALSGALSALAALVLVGSQASGDPNIGTSFILDSIAVVVIGGTAVTGGAGGIIRTMVGACIYIMIGYILFALNVSQDLVVLVKSAALLVVIAIGGLGSALTTYLGER